MNEVPSKKPTETAALLPRDPRARSRLVQALAMWLFEQEQTETRRSRMRELR